MQKNQYSAGAHCNEVSYPTVLSGNTPALPSTSGDTEEGDQLYLGASATAAQLSKTTHSSQL